MQTLSSAVKPKARIALAQWFIIYKLFSNLEYYDFREFIKCTSNKARYLKENVQLESSDKWTE